MGLQRKLAAHLSDCRATGMDFVPIVVETLGGLSEDAIFTVQVIGKPMSKHANPDDPSTRTGQLFHRLAISLWRGNARLWLHRHLPLPLPVDGIKQGITDGIVKHYPVRIPLTANLTVPKLI